jgi:ATP-dependent DNA ligase
MGMRHESMLKLFDPAAQDIYNSCSSLKMVCEQVSKPGREKVAFSPVNYFAACKPMLASSPPWQQAVERMKGNPFFVEPKFDGERLLLHKKDGVVKLFTRNSIDYTNRYNYGRTFTPIVLQALPDHESDAPKYMHGRQQTTIAHGLTQAARFVISLPLVA